MNYKTRPGVVLVSICKMPVLVPTRTAYAACKQIQAIPYDWAMIWENLRSGKSFDNIIRFKKVLSKKPEEEICRELEDACKQMCALGFLIAEET